MTMIIAKISFQENKILIEISLMFIYEKEINGLN